MQPNPFEDAICLWARAQRHLAEYRALPSPWRFQEVQDLGTGEWGYSLALDRENLRFRKPIISDIANNLIHALDQVLAVCLRAHGTPRGRLSYPVHTDDARFAAALIPLRKAVGPEVVALIERVRQDDPFRARLGTLKALSNSAKHWALAPPAAEISAAGIASPAGRVVFDVPEGHFQQNAQFPIHRGPERFHPLATELLVAMRFEGLAEDDGSDPMSVFTSGSRHVAEVLTAVTSLFGGPVFRPSSGGVM